MKEACSTGNARTRALAVFISEMDERSRCHGEGAVAIGWVKSHIGIAGNEGADKVAKIGTTRGTDSEVTEGDIRQFTKSVRKLGMGASRLAN